VCGVPVGAPAMLLHHSLFGGLDQTRGTTGNGKTALEDSETLERLQVDRRAAIEQVMLRVGSEAGFGRVSAEEAGGLAAETSAVDGSGASGSQSMTGLFRARVGTGPAAVPKLVHWCRVESIALFFIAHTSENITMTQTVLVAMTKKILGLVPQIATQPTDVLQFPDELAAVEHFYLPNGLIMFGNEDVFAQAGKDTDLFLSNKAS